MTDNIKNKGGVIRGRSLLFESGSDTKAMMQISRGQGKSLLTGSEIVKIIDETIKENVRKESMKRLEVFGGLGD